MDLANISLALGSSLAAGLNLYLTVLTLGLLGGTTYFPCLRNSKCSATHGY